MWMVGHQFASSDLGGLEFITDLDIYEYLDHLLNLSIFIDLHTYDGDGDDDDDDDELILDYIPGTLQVFHMCYHIPRSKIVAHLVGVESPREGLILFTTVLGRSKLSTVICGHNSAKALSALQIPSVLTQFLSSLPSLCRSPRLHPCSSSFSTRWQNINSHHPCLLERLNTDKKGDFGSCMLNIAEPQDGRSMGH
ncbi:uncharacterized protein WM277_010468 [Molossus nigricans]